MKEEFEQKTKDLEVQIAEFRSLIAAGNIHSTILSDKASCRVEKEQEQEEKKLVKKKDEIAKKLMAVKLMVDAAKHDGDCFAIDRPPPPPEQKGLRKCKTAVDSIDNKVAFGVAFEEGDEMSVSVHGVPLQPGFVRVAVDGSIKDDAQVPVPIVGEMETVHQAIGSHLAWPKDMIIFASTTCSEVCPSAFPFFCSIALK
ncbi:hypothetical protein ACET3Z_010484 [Daucus carota]